MKTGGLICARLEEFFKTVEEGVESSVQKGKERRNAKRIPSIYKDLLQLVLETELGTLAESGQNVKKMKWKDEIQTRFRRDSDEIQTRFTSAILSFANGLDTGSDLGNCALVPFAIQNQSN